MEVKCNKDQNISGIYRPVTVNVILQLPQIESILFKGLIIWQERRLINTILKNPSQSLYFLLIEGISVLKCLKNIFQEDIVADNNIIHICLLYPH